MPVISYFCNIGQHSKCQNPRCQCPCHDQSLPRLQLQYPEWIINWSDELLTARHLVTQQVLTATSIPDLRSQLERPESSEDPQ